MRVRHLARGLALVVLVALAACRARGVLRPSPFSAEAQAALAEARTLERLRPAGWLPRAAALAQEAEEKAPAWVAPRRFQDDLARERLDGHGALAARRAALTSGGAAELYLAARLEGREARAEMERAVARDPGLAWARHGLAWHLFDAGEERAALRSAERALALAAGAYERAFFALALARLELDLERVEEAAALLAEVLADPGLGEPERSEVAAELVVAELRSRDEVTVERGFWRGAEWLASGTLAAGEYERLGSALLERRARLAHSDPLAVWLAALGPDGPEGTRAARERLRLRLWIERGERALAGAWLAGAGEGLRAGPFQRVRDFERGAPREAIERWCAALPAVVRDEQGLPRLAPLRALVLAARAPEGPEYAGNLGQALLTAGWFTEAESFAVAMMGAERDAALELRTRAAGGQALLAGIRSVLESVDRGERALVPGAAEARELHSLDDLLGALAPLFERFLGPAAADEVRRSPRLSFGGLAALVHPGPQYSAADERAGLGRAGAPVPGLAQELARLNRFGIFGRAPGGGGPDGTVLRRIGLEWKEGAHLGVAFQGLVAWCEGADVPSRPARVGAGISGAALHEGYWIDVESVRAEHARLTALAAELATLPEGALDEALAERGPRLAPGADAHEAARFLAPLGEGQRVLVALLRERGGRALELEELLAVTALHEEGHLTDRTRFLPLARHWPAVLTFGLRHLFSPRALARALEYRAELTALCSADEPRLVLADCLAASEDSGGFLTHGEAYHELVQGLLQELAQQRAAYPGLDPERYVLYQLHTLGADELRRAALALARREGLVAPGFEAPQGS